MQYFKLLYNLYRMKKNEKKTPAQLRQLQEEKLQKMLQYAYDHSEYYHKTFAQAGITGENIAGRPLSSFPAIDKAQLLQRFDELVTVPDLKQEELCRFDEREASDRKPYLGKYHLVHSSGSTGKPGYFVYDENAWNTMLVGIIRAARRTEVQTEEAKRSRSLRSVSEIPAHRLPCTCTITIRRQQLQGMWEQRAGDCRFTITMTMRTGKQCSIMIFIPVMISLQMRRP